MEQSNKQKKKPILAERLLPGYKFNKWIFRAVYVVTIVLFLFAVWGVGRTEIYLKCPSDSPRQCRNPFVPETEYLPNGTISPFNARVEPCTAGPEICSHEYLVPGESIGKPPSFLYANFGMLLLATYLIAFIINHLLFNRGYKFQEGLDTDAPKRE